MVGSVPLLKGGVIQFKENHKWCGCFGMIKEWKEVGTEDPLVKDIRYMVGVPTPEGTAYIYVMDSENAMEFIGMAKLIFKDE